MKRRPEDRKTVLQKIIARAALDASKHYPGIQNYHAEIQRQIARGNFTQCAFDDGHWWHYIPVGKRREFICLTIAFDTTRTKRAFITT